ncbi:MAG: DMT family transporter [Bacilli bacterium]|nr:DMT family transporter [Bacilli bacterium]
MKRTKPIAFITLIIVVALWGVAPVISKSIFDGAVYSPGILIALRGLFSIIAMAIIINKGFKKVNKSYLICIPAGIILAAAYIFQFVGLKYTVPSKNAFLENISCITIPLFMFIFVREKPTWYSIVSALICVVGSLFLVGNGFDFLHFFRSGNLLGDGLSAIGGLFFGLDIAFTKVFCKDKDPLLYVFFQLVILTVVATGYSFIFEMNVFNEFAISFEILDILQVIFLGVICTALCWVARAWAMKSIDAVTVSLLVPLSAVIASVLSICLKLENFTWNLLIGGVIILLSIAVSAIFDYRKECQAKKHSIEEETKHEECQSQL